MSTFSGCCWLQQGVGAAQQEQWMQTQAVSTSRVCSPRLETRRATGLRHFPESLGTAEHARTCPLGHNSQSPMGPR